jgi:hypothetical protein
LPKKLLPEISILSFHHKVEISGGARYPVHIQGMPTDEQKPNARFARGVMNAL